MRRVDFITFNSLFEILIQPKLDGERVFLTFNSLFEIRRNRANTKISRDKSLSILFLRFVKVMVKITLTPCLTFNSLFEIQRLVAAVEYLITVQGIPFNSLFEIR